MAVLLVTYDLKQPGRNYAPVHAYLKQFNYCKGLESVWLLDTTMTAAQVRDGLNSLIDANDTTFVTPIGRAWASWGFSCGNWLNDGARNW
jgi:hypothetical protein